MGRSEREALDQMTMERNLALAQCKDLARQFNEELDKVKDLTEKNNGISAMISVLVDENDGLRKRLELALRLLKDGGQTGENT